VDESTLVQQAQAGDANAFEELVNQYALFVYNLALRVLRDPQEAEEAAQEAFLRVWRSLDSFRQKAKFRTWLYTIVTNVCYDRLPKLKQELISMDVKEVILPDVDNLPEERVITEEKQQLLQQAIDDLPEHYKLLITLRHLQEMSYDEIAEVTGQPLGTVKTGIYRARRLLAERIKAYGR
jgi:RNA polymerase sigma factor (sigma-70 family)